MTESRNQPTGAAFLLAQLGAHAANRFAARIADLGLSPADVGLLRMIAARPGRSQQSLAADLGVVPSRVTALIDPLDRAGLVERRRSTGDRRNYELHLTPEAARVMDEIKKTAIAHEADITSALDPSQRAQLITLLELIAADQNLTPGVHPGYRR
ncbi:MarR family winged helix-turn-helix transcriptional regulator [Actinomadura rubrisoli]|uniref:MarR family winged helix-turn-helix transcriptional regulator n=1 Tax=Actinomadura rubrisoli TaxID=2530368 RepID=UPI001FB57DCE|nr:MarR family winged helix-turn-helix transcriptional regulator [Actinomadura rubrisoli]